MVLDDAKMSLITLYANLCILLLCELWMFLTTLPFLWENGPKKITFYHTCFHMCMCPRWGRCTTI